jgi:hypothetical protein
VPVFSVENWNQELNGKTTTCNFGNSAEGRSNGYDETFP